MFTTIHHKKTVPKPRVPKRPCYLFVLALILCMNNVGAIENLRANGAFDLFPNGPIDTGTGWINNESTKWNIYYTSSSTLHSAQFVNGNLSVITGSDGGINDISIGGVPSTDPTPTSWSTYGTVVKPNTQYTAFVFMNVNKTNANYFNIRQAYTNGTNIAALISSRNTGTGFQYMEYTFTTGNDVKYCRVGMVTRNANTGTIYHAIGLYEGAGGQLNKPTQILSITPDNAVQDTIQPVFSITTYDIDCDVGIYNQGSFLIQSPDNSSVFLTVPFNSCSPFQYTYLFYPQGTYQYSCSITDMWNNDAYYSTYFYIPAIDYTNDIADPYYYKLSLFQVIGILLLTIFLSYYSQSPVINNILFLFSIMMTVYSIYEVIEGHEPLYLSIIAVLYLIVAIYNTDKKRLLKEATGD